MIILDPQHANRWSYDAKDVQELRALMDANGGRISAALGVMYDGGKLNGLTPDMMIEVVRMAEKTMRDRHWCSPEHIAQFYDCIAPKENRPISEAVGG